MILVSFYLSDYRRKPIFTKVLGNVSLTSCCELLPICGTIHNACYFSCILMQLSRLYGVMPFRLSLFYQRIGAVRLLSTSHRSTSLLLGYDAVIVLGVQQFDKSVK